MTPSSLLLLLLFFTFMISPTKAHPNSELRTTLSDFYDDGSEMNERIISQFIESPECQQKCQRYNKNQLMNQFESFRAEWVAQMINFVISQLGIDADSAKQVRKNPSNYMINYETFKLLTFK